MSKEIVFEDVCKNYGSLKVLQGVSFAIEKGEVVCLLGSSGCGKSTTLRMINMLEQKDKGKITVKGVDLEEVKDINAYRSSLAMVFQQFHLFDNCDVIQNCMLALVKVKKIDKKKAEIIAIENLKKVGMENFAKARVSTLSGGQKQRVAIARALCLEPDILLFDEPTSALDPEMTGEVLSVIKSLTHQGKTMMIVTHEMAFAKEVADRILFMDKEKVIEDAIAKEFFSDPKTERAKEFLKREVH